ncbi:MAG: hypothetical protein LBU32_03995 [Clostridiales bacterium]|nr:hypothetical protein [Clostridiales bacterium]
MAGERRRLGRPNRPSIFGINALNAISGERQTAVWESGAAAPPLMPVEERTSRKQPLAKGRIRHDRDRRPYGRKTGRDGQSRNIQAGPAWTGTWKAWRSASKTKATGRSPRRAPAFRRQMGSQGLGTDGCRGKLALPCDGRPSQNT